MIEAAVRDESLAPLEPGKLPFKVCMWRLVVEPRRPKAKSEGGILLAEQVRAADEQLTSVGRVLQVGEFAYESKTPAGLDLSKAMLKAKVGDWVMFARYTGSEVNLISGHRVMLVNDTDILAIVTDPEAIKAYV